MRLTDDPTDLTGLRERGLDLRKHLVSRLDRWMAPQGSFRRTALCEGPEIANGIVTPFSRFVGGSSSLVAELNNAGVSYPDAQLTDLLAADESEWHVDVRDRQRAINGVVAAAEAVSRACRDSRLGTSPTTLTWEVEGSGETVVLRTKATGDIEAANSLLVLGFSLLPSALMHFSGDGPPTHPITAATPRT